MPGCNCNVGTTQSIVLVATADAVDVFNPFDTNHVAKHTDLAAAAAAVTIEWWHPDVNVNRATDQKQARYISATTSATVSAAHPTSEDS